MFHFSWIQTAVKNIQAYIHQTRLTYDDEYIQIIKGSTAVTLAAWVSGKITFRPAIAILTGSHSDNPLHQEFIREKTGS
jgi:hypothetical protein